MSIPLKQRKLYTGVSFDPAVLEYLDTIVRQTGWNRSWVINAIVQEHARLARNKNTPLLPQTEAIIRIS